MTSTKWTLSISLWALVCLLPPSCPNPTDPFENPSRKFLEERALTLWTTRLFHEYFVSPHFSPSQVEEGSSAYNKLKKEGFSSSGTSGFLHDIPLSTLKEAVNQFHQRGALSSSELQEQLILVAGQVKQIREHSFLRENGEIIYGTTGFVPSSPSSPSIEEQGQKGTLLFSFRKFKLQASPSSITYRRGGHCVMWGIVCETKFDLELPEVEGEETATGSLPAFWRAEALKHFKEETQGFAQYIITTAEKYRRFLSKVVEEKVRKIEENGDTRQDELFQEDPIDWNKLEL